jgi:hypothetical protein
MSGYLGPPREDGCHMTNARLAAISRCPDRVGIKRRDPTDPM